MVDRHDRVVAFGQLVRRGEPLWAHQLGHDRRWADVDSSVGRSMVRGDQRLDPRDRLIERLAQRREVECLVRDLAHVMAEDPVPLLGCRVAEHAGEDHAQAAGPVDLERRLGALGDAARVVAVVDAPVVDDRRDSGPHRLREVERRGEAAILGRVDRGAGEVDVDQPVEERAVLFEATAQEDVDHVLVGADHAGHDDATAAVDPALGGRRPSCSDRLYPAAADGHPAVVDHLTIRIHRQDGNPLDDQVRHRFR